MANAKGPLPRGEGLFCCAPAPDGPLPARFTLIQSLSLMPQHTHIPSPHNRDINAAPSTARPSRHFVDSVEGTGAASDRKRPGQRAIALGTGPQAYDMAHDFRHQADGASTDSNEIDVS